MIWNTHYNLRGKHAFLSPSKTHWVNYTPLKLRESYDNHTKAAMGTKIHNFAEQAITLGIRLPNTRATLNAFVNDAIGFRMDPEVLLYVSDNIFGTVDAIGFDEATNTLRIHDLKTGTTPGKTLQLDIYTAMFCMEYKHNPNEITMICRIYQNDEVLEWFPDPGDILEIIDIIISHNNLINEIKGE